MLPRSVRSLRYWNRTCDSLYRLRRLAECFTGYDLLRIGLRHRYLCIPLVFGVPGIGVRNVRSKGTAGAKTVHIESIEPFLLRFRTVVDRDGFLARLERFSIE